MKCTVCKTPIGEDEELCDNCNRKFNSDSYKIEYCSNCLKIVAFSQQKVQGNKYIEYKGRCPRCKFNPKGFQML